MWPSWNTALPAPLAAIEGYAPDATAHAALLEAGAPVWLADNLVGLFGLLRRGAGAEVTDTVRTLTGHPPRTFAAFARDHAAALGG